MLQIGRTLKVNGTGTSAPQSSAVNPTNSKPLVGNTFLGRTYNSDVVRSANENKRELLSRNLPSTCRHAVHGRQHRPLDGR